MGELKSYMIPEMIGDKSCGYFGYISFANGTDQERVVNIKAYRFSNGVRYKDINLTIPPRRVVNLGDFQKNEYQEDGISIFSKSLGPQDAKCVISVRCDERIIISPYIGMCINDGTTAPSLVNVQECDNWL